MQDEVNQEESEQDEVDGAKEEKGMNGCVFDTFVFLAMIYLVGELTGVPVHPLWD